MNRGSWQCVAECTFALDAGAPIEERARILPGSWGVDEAPLIYTPFGELDFRLSSFANGEITDSNIEVHVEASCWSTAADSGNPYWCGLVRTPFPPPLVGIIRIHMLTLSAGVVALGDPERCHIRVWRRAPG